MSGPQTTVDELVGQLRALGVGDGSTVMAHVSMRRVGPVVGGAAGVVEALDRAVGPAGSVLVNVGVADEHGWVNDRPEAERAALLRDAVPFDAATTPADPDNGVFAEVFRTTPGTLVSDHPEGRFGARGAAAAALVSDVPWDDYYGRGSPLDRLVQRGGHVLRLGADVDTVTLLHLAEYLAPLPEKRRVRRHRLVRAPGGAVVRTIECLDDSDGIVARPPDAPDYFGLVLAAYLATARAALGRVGGARSELLDAADLVAFATAWMAAHLA